jgi:hypothetical protein
MFELSSNGAFSSCLIFSGSLVVVVTLSPLRVTISIFATAFTPSYSCAFSPPHSLVGLPQMSHGRSNLGWLAMRSEFLSYSDRLNGDGHGRVLIKRVPPSLTRDALHSLTCAVGFDLACLHDVAYEVA